MIPKRQLLEFVRGLSRKHRRCFLEAVARGLGECGGEGGKPGPCATGKADEPKAQPASGDKPKPASLPVAIRSISDHFRTLTSDEARAHFDKALGSTTDFGPVVKDILGGIPKPHTRKRVLDHLVRQFETRKESWNRTQFR